MPKKIQAHTKKYKLVKKIQACDGDSAKIIQAYSARICSNCLRYSATSLGLAFCLSNA